MTQSSGVLTYEGPHGVSGIIESIVNIEIRRPYAYEGDHEDLKQEMRMAAIRAMVKYDSTRIGPSPFKFLQQCIRNHLYNLHRGVHVPNNPPCVRCEFWDKVNKTCIIDEIGCEAIVKYRNNMKLKAAIRQPDHLSDHEMASLKGNQDVSAFILDESIRSRLPEELVSDYVKMISGQEKEVDARRKSKIRKIVRAVMQEE